MSAPVLQLPRAAHGAELEARVVGAALHLGIDLSTFEALGIAAEDFTVETNRKAWLIARTKASRRLEVTGPTVASAGRTGNWFSPGEAQAVENLALENLLGRAEFLQLAADFRSSCHQARLITALEAEVRNLRSASFNPGRTAGTLEALALQLQRDTAPDEDASGDVVELLDTWDTAERTGKSRLQPTRIAVLDAEIGGLPPGLTVFASAPGVGKTAVLDSMIRAQLEADPELHLGFFGLEDGTSHIARRWMAADTGMLLRDIGWAPRTPEQRIAVEAAAERFHPLLSRLHVYRHDTITPGELVARAVSMRVKYRVGGVYVDNLTEVDFAQRRATEQHFEAVAELGRRLRNFGLREEVPVALIAHTTGTLKAGDIPQPSDLAGGQALARRARLFFGLWAKGDAIRCTTGKANELGAAGVTVEFARLKTAGLIDPTQGEKVNLHAERAAERAVKARDGVLAQIETAKLRKTLRAEEPEPIKAPSLPAQASLLPGGPDAP